MLILLLKFDYLVSYGNFSFLLRVTGDMGVRKLCIVEFKDLVKGSEPVIVEVHWLKRWSSLFKTTCSLCMSLVEEMSCHMLVKAQIYIGMISFI
jgi:hypothetical protein